MTLKKLLCGLIVLLPSFWLCECQNVSMTVKTITSTASRSVSSTKMSPVMTCIMRKDFLYMTVKFFTKVMRSSSDVKLGYQQRHFNATPSPYKYFTDCILKLEGNFPYAIICKTFNPLDYALYRINLLLGNVSYIVAETFRPMENLIDCTLGDDVMNWNISLVSSKQVEIYGNISESAAIMMYRISFMAFLRNGSKLTERRCDVDDVDEKLFRCSINMLNPCQHYKFCVQINMTSFMKLTQCFNITTPVSTTVKTITSTASRSVSSTKMSPVMTCIMRKDFLYMTVKFFTKVMRSSSDVKLGYQQRHFNATPSPYKYFTDCILKLAGNFLYAITCKTFNPVDSKWYRIHLILGNVSHIVAETYEPIDNFKDCTLGDDVMDWNISLVSSKQVEIYGNISTTAAAMMYGISFMAFLRNSLKLAERRCDVDVMDEKLFRCSINMLNPCQHYRFCVQLHMPNSKKLTQCSNITTTGDEVIDWNVTMVTSNQVEIDGSISVRAALTMYHVTFVAFLLNGTKITENGCMSNESNRSFSCGFRALQPCQRYKFCVQIKMAPYFLSSRCVNLNTTDCSPNVSTVKGGSSKFNIGIGVGVSLLLLGVAVGLILWKTSCRRPLTCLQRSDGYQEELFDGDEGL